MVLVTVTVTVTVMVMLDWIGERVDLLLGLLWKAVVQCMLVLSDFMRKDCKDGKENGDLWSILQSITPYATVIYIVSQYFFFCVRTSRLYSQDIRCFEIDDNDRREPSTMTQTRETCFHRMIMLNYLNL